MIRINFMKRNVTTLWYWLMTWIVIMLILTLWFMFNKSDETIIINSIQELNNSIKEDDNLINELEESKKIKWNKVNCLTQQLNRRIEWLEYNISYCDSEENLNKFSGL